MNTRTIMLLLLPSFLLFVGCATTNTGGLSSEEAKQWTQAAKEYQQNPAALKQLTEERNRYREEAQMADQRVAAVQAELAQDQNQKAEMEQQVAMLNNRLMAAEQANQALQQQLQQQMTQPGPTPPSGGGTGNADNYDMGVVYRIQVGAYKTGGVPSKFNQYPDLFVESAGGLDKVMIGAYRDYNDARARLGQLKGEGYGSAWVVAYKNGGRVPLSEARN